MNINIYNFIFIICFLLTYNFWKYLSSYNQYYKTLKLLHNQYTIEDIQIFWWNITFTLSENKDKEVIIEFKENDLYIDWSKFYFQRKTTVIFELIKTIIFIFSR